MLQNYFFNCLIRVTYMCTSKAKNKSHFFWHLYLKKHIGANVSTIVVHLEEIVLDFLNYIKHPSITRRKICGLKLKTSLQFMVAFTISWHFSSSAFHFGTIPFPFNRLPYFYIYPSHCTTPHNRQSEILKCKSD